MMEPMLKKKSMFNRIFKRQFFVTICTIFLLVFILVGSSYALLNAKTETGLTDVVVQSGNLIATISSDSEIIQMNYTTLGVSDEVGLSYDPYTFAVSNDGENKILYYELRIVDKEYEISTLPHKALNYALSVNGSDYTNPQNLGDNKSYIYVGGSLDVGESDTFNLKLWVNEEFGKYANNKEIKASIELTLYSDIPTRNYIIYDSQGGSYIPKTNIVSKRISMQKPVKAGYSFIGWSSTPDGEVEYEANAIYNGTNGMTLYAVWGVPTAVDKIISKLGTDGLVAVNADGELAEDGDEIREYRYSGNAKHCTYTFNGNTYPLNIDIDTCPTACYVDLSLWTGQIFFMRSDSEYLENLTCEDLEGLEVVANEIEPLEGEVKNYIWYNDEMWRILGVFSEKTSDGVRKELLKIVRDEPLLQNEVPNDYTYNGEEFVIKGTLYVDTKYAYMQWRYQNFQNYDSNLSDWTQAGLQYYLNDESGTSSYYNSIENNYQRMIETIEYNVSNTEPGFNAKTSYINERSGNVVTGNQATWTGKIGLIYPSDYGYAASNSKWATNMIEYGLLSNQGAFNNWMNDNKRILEYTMSPFSENYVIMVGEGGGITALGANAGAAVSPVLYLKSDVVITDGNGSKGNPYIVVMNNDSSGGE